MIGYESYSVEYINENFWSGNDSFHMFEFHCPSYDNCRKIEHRDLYTKLYTQSNSVATLKEDPSIIGKTHTLHKGDRLYFDKACSMPKSTGYGIWIHAQVPHGADAIVVPAPSDGLAYYPQAAIFSNTDEHKLYIILDYTRVVNGFMLTDSLEDVFYNNRMFLYKDFFDSHPTLVKQAENTYCSYKGPIIYYDNKNKFIFDIIEGRYPSIIFEDDLMGAIRETGQEFTMENIDNLLSMLGSSDKDSVHLGLRTLAAMDYVHYPSVTKYILHKKYYDWRDEAPNTVSVKFMLKHLDFDHDANAIFNNVTKEEFPLAKQLFERFVKDDIDEVFHCAANHTNLDATCDIALNINYPER